MIFYFWFGIGLHNECMQARDTMHGWMMDMRYLLGPKAHPAARQCKTRRMCGVGSTGKPVVFSPTPGYKDSHNHIGSSGTVSVIKLTRTDTTLDLSQRPRRYEFFALLPGL